jgi:hypothetical protein
LTPGSGDPGWVKKSRSGTRDEHPGSYFLELRNNFLGLKILKFLDTDPDPGYGIFLTVDSVSGMEKFGSRIRNTGLGHVPFLTFGNDKRK